jgi:hypothetical protein
MYRTKRDDQYLGSLAMVRIPKGSWAAYAATEVQRRGVSDDHYKHPCLVLDEAFLTRFPTIETVDALSAADGSFPLRASA